jgi:hypothetical protein
MFIPDPDFFRPDPEPGDKSTGLEPDPGSGTLFAISEKGIQNFTPIPEQIKRKN